MRFIYFLFAFLVITRPADAQLGYGPEIGIGMSSMNFAPPVYPIDYTQASVSPIFSGKVGGLIDIPIDKHVYFQVGISIAREGAVRSFSFYESDSNNESVHQTLYINYLNVPVNFIYKTGIQGKGRFIFGLGATPAYIIGGRNKLNDQGMFNDTPLVSITNTQITSKTHTIGSFDIGVSLSVGYELPTGLFFRAYYTDGVNDIGVGSEVDKNRMWGIAAGYLFGKGRNINKDDDDLIDKSTNP